MTQNRVTNAGGQAVIEGVMMRTPEYFVVAVRRPDKSIKVKSRRWRVIFPQVFKKPFMRGMLVLYESMFNGIEALTWSFNESVEDEKEKEKLTPMSTFFSIALAFLFAMLLFVAIPHGAAYFLEKWVRGTSSINSMAFHAIDGLIKVIVFTAYLWAISLMKDVKRLFTYHGAEHKAIYTFEKGEALTLENARKYTTLHPRCGTSFMILVIVISILLFTVFFAFMPPVTGNKILDNIIYIFIKILLVFPIGGFSYEMQRYVSRHPENRLLTILIAPGLWFQHITTVEPEDDVLEIGLAALSKAIYLQHNKIDLPENGIEEQFADFNEFQKSVAGLTGTEESCLI